MHDDFLKKVGVETEPPAAFGKNPALPRSPEQQSWGTALAIIIIVAMVVVGAAYTWNKRTTGQYEPAPVVAATSTQG